ACDLRLGKTETHIEFLFKVLDNPRQELDAPVVDQHRNQVAHLPVDAFTLYIRIQQPALLFRRNRWILPTPPQIFAFGQLACDLAQSTHGSTCIEVDVKNYVREGSRLRAGDRSHCLVSVLSRILGWA